MVCVRRHQDAWIWIYTSSLCCRKFKGLSRRTLKTRPRVSVEGTDWSQERWTVVITHGFLASADSPWVRDLEQALLEIVRKHHTVQLLQVLITFIHYSTRFCAPSSHTRSVRGDYQKREIGTFSFCILTLTCILFMSVSEELTNRHYFYF